jgi:hypothetical protein
MPPSIATIGSRFTKRVRGAMLIAGLSAFALAAGLVQNVFADPRDFTLENDSLSYITHLYVSPSSSDSWGDDVLGVDVLDPGQSVDITFDPSSGRTCIYDLLVVTHDGARTRKNRENLCTTSTEYYSED